MATPVVFPHQTVLHFTAPEVEQEALAHPALAALLLWPLGEGRYLVDPEREDDLRATLIRLGLPGPLVNGAPRERCDRGGSAPPRLCRGREPEAPDRPTPDASPGGVRTVSLKEFTSRTRRGARAPLSF